MPDFEVLTGSPFLRLLIDGSTSIPTVQMTTQIESIYPDLDPFMPLATQSFPLVSTESLPPFTASSPPHGQPSATLQWLREKVYSQLIGFDPAEVAEVVFLVIIAWFLSKMMKRIRVIILFIFVIVFVYKLSIIPSIF